MNLRNCNLGPFVLEKLLGEGATGQVWLSDYDKSIQALEKASEIDSTVPELFEWLARSNDHRVAIKFLRSQLFTDSWALESFERELRATSRLYHPNIASLHDYGDLASTPADHRIIDRFGTQAPFLILEHIEGNPLGSVRKKLEWPDLHEIIRQLLLALGHAHARGIIHRDIKPSNIMIFTQQGSPSCKLVDFGLALHSMGE